MYQSIEEVTLKSGEKVEAGAVLGPDSDWKDRLLQLLAHKPPIWQWQVTQFLTRDLGIEPRHYILHRDGTPFSHILTVEYNGVGILGHVWTVPEDRGQGAAGLLMGSLLGDFKQRGGKALFLTTGFESAPYRIYSKHGFRGFEPGSGKMAWFADSEEAFEADWFKSDDAQIQPVSWVDYATASALFASGKGGIIRNLPLRLFGRCITESGLLDVLKEQAENPTDDSRFSAFSSTKTGALFGLAGWAADPLWPGTVNVDVFCYPGYWDRAGELLNQLAIPPGTRVVTYVDESFEAKHTVLEAAGFKSIAVLPDWVANDCAGIARSNVLVYERS